MRRQTTEIKPEEKEKGSPLFQRFLMALMRALAVVVV